MIGAEQRVAFASLRAIWPDQRIVLIGAGALRAHKKLVRFTVDLDIAVAIDLGEYPGGLQRSGDWTADADQPQRWVHDNGVQIDVIPAGPNLRAQGHVNWAARRLSLAGFSALFVQPLPFLDQSLRIEVATIPLVVLLKMVAWLDRPGERLRDLNDLAFLLTDYLDESDEPSFDRILDAIQHRHAQHHNAHAFLLGQDIARCEGAAAIAPRFLRLLSTEHQWMLAEMQRNGPAALSHDVTFDAVWAGFVRGLGSSS